LTFYVKGKAVSEKEFRSATSGSTFWKKEFAKRDATSSSSSSRKVSSSNAHLSSAYSQQDLNAVASSFYGQSYSELNENRRQLVKASLYSEAQRQQAGTSKASTLSSGVQSRMTQEAQDRTEAETRAKLEASAKRIEEQREKQEVITKTARVQAQAQTKQRQAQEVSSTVQKEQQAIVTLQKKETNIYTPEIRRDKSGEFISSARPLTFSDVVHTTEYLEEEKGALERARPSKEKMVSMWKDIKKDIKKDPLKLDLKTDKAKLKLAAETEVTKETIDKVQKDFFGSKVLTERFLETDTTTEQYRSTFVMPEKQKREQQYETVITNIQTFYDKEALKTTGKIVGTAAIIVAAPTVIAAVSTTHVGAAVVSSKAFALGIKGLQVAYGTSVLYRGTKIVSGKGLALEEGKIKVVSPYKDKPTKRVLEAVGLGAELTGVATGVSILKLKQLDPTTYKKVKSTQSEIKQARVQVGKESITIKPKQYIVKETGTIKTFAGKVKQVSTTYKYDVTGKGTYKVSVAASKGAKPIYTEAGKLNIESSIYSPTGVRSYAGGQLVIQKSPLKPSKTFSTTEFKSLGKGKVTIYKGDTLRVGTARPYKFTTEAVLTGKVKTSVVSSKGRIQTLVSDKRTDLSFFERISKSTTQTTTKGKPSYKYSEIKADVGVQETIIQTKGKLIDTTFTTTTTGYSKITPAEKVNLKPAYNLIAMGKRGLGHLTLVAPQQQIKPALAYKQSIKGISELGLGAVTTIAPSPVLLIPSVSLRGQTKEAIIKEDVLMKQKVINEPVLDVKVKEKVAVIELVLPPKIIPTTKVKQATLQQEAIIEEVIEPITEEPVTPVEIQPTTIIEPTVIIPPLIPVTLEERKKVPQEARGYDVFVRERGVFKKITKGSLSRVQAMDFGAYRVGTTARASFLLKPSTSLRAKPLGASKGYYQRFRMDFKVKDNIFIEKKEKRIKSTGEKAEITLKGLEAIKRKRKGSIFGSIKKIRW